MDISHCECHVNYFQNIKQTGHLSEMSDIIKVNVLTDDNNLYNVGNDSSVIRETFM